MRYFWNLQSLSQQPSKHSATPPTQQILFTTQILGGHMTNWNQGLSSNKQQRQGGESLGTRLHLQKPPLILVTWPFSFCIETALTSFPTPFRMNHNSHRLTRMILVHLDMVCCAVFQTLASYLPSVLHKKNYSSGRQETGSYWVKGLKLPCWVDRSNFCN